MLCTRRYLESALTEALVSRRLPVDDGPLDVLPICESEVCEAANEGAGWHEGRVSLRVLDFAVWSNIGSLSSWDDDANGCELCSDRGVER